MNNQEEWCHYSDLPSPMAYVDNTDYDGMGNQGRFPKDKLSNGKSVRAVQRVRFG